MTGPAWFLARLLLALAFLGGVAGVMAVAVALGAPVPAGDWELPLRSLLQEHSLIILAFAVPAVVFGTAVARSLKRVGMAGLSVALGLLSLAGAILPLGQALLTVRLTDERMREAFGDAYGDALEAESIPVRPSPIDLARWTNLPVGLPEADQPVTAVYREADGEPLMLDLYQPSDDSHTSAIVLVHGGGLTSGRRTDTRLWALDFASRGYLVASVDYRLAPEVPPSEAAEDVLCAVGWLRAQPQMHDGDWLGVIGYSSGGHLALLAGYYSASGVRLEGCPQADISIQAVVALAPVTDLGFYPAEELGFDPNLDHQRALGASPLVQARSGAPSPPILVVHGRRDDVVEFSQSEIFVDAVSRSGGTAVLLGLPWSGHAFQAFPGGLANQVALFYIDRFFVSTR